jgi:hypothetical protein
MGQGDLLLAPTRASRPAQNTRGGPTLRFSLQKQGGQAANAKDGGRYQGEENPTVKSVHAFSLAVLNVCNVT